MGIWPRMFVSSPTASATHCKVRQGSVADNLARPTCSIPDSVRVAFLRLGALFLRFRVAFFFWKVVKTNPDNPGQQTPGSCANRRYSQLKSKMKGISLKDAKASIGVITKT